MRATAGCGWARRRRSCGSAPIRSAGRARCSARSSRPRTRSPTRRSSSIARMSWRADRAGSPTGCPARPGRGPPTASPRRARSTGRRTARHLREVTPPDDQLRAAGRANASTNDGDLGGIVLAVGVERDDRGGAVVERVRGSRPGAPRPCRRWGPGGGRWRRPPRLAPRCRRSSRRRRPAPAGAARAASTTAAMRGPSW